MATENFDNSKVINLLIRQKELYGRLKSLAMAQKELVEKSNPELLLKVLANRQKIINKLTEVDRELKPMRANWKEISEGFSDLERQKVNLLVDDVKSTIEEILTRDKADTEALTVKKDEIATELKKVRAGKQVNNAYKSSVSSGGSKYFDIGG